MSNGKYRRTWSCGWWTTCNRQVAVVHTVRLVRRCNKQSLLPPSFCRSIAGWSSRSVKRRDEECWVRDRSRFLHSNSQKRRVEECWVRDRSRFLHSNSQKRRVEECWVRDRSRSLRSHSRKRVLGCSSGRRLHSVQPCCRQPKRLLRALSITRDR